MSPADLQALAATDYRAALAIATVSLAESISSLAVTIRVVTIGSVIAGLAAVVIIVWICRDIIRMSRDDKRRHAEHNKRHAETMARLRRDGKALDALIRRTEDPRGIEGTRHIGRRYRD